MTYIAYSLASHNALTRGHSVEDVIARTCGRFQIDPSLLVVFATEASGDLGTYDGGRWPADAAIVFRGENSLAQSYRAAQ